MSNDFYYGKTALPMRKIQLGAGPNALEGWENFQEGQADITKRLPFDDSTIDFILIEHVVEHVTHKNAWSFLLEALRILKPGGVIRVIVPSVDRIWKLCDDDYHNFMVENVPQWCQTWGVPKPNPPYVKKHWIAAILFLHGHQSAWNESLLLTIMEAAGFTVESCEYRKSKHAELNDVDQHWKLMGLNRCIIESAVVEGTKPE